MTMFPRYFCSQCKKEIPAANVNPLKQEHICFYCETEAKGNFKRTDEQLKELEFKVKGYLEAQERIAYTMITEGESIKRVMKLVGLPEDRVKQMVSEVFDKGMDTSCESKGLTESVGVVHDTSTFQFESKIEEYIGKKFGYEIDVELIQDRNTTGGLLMLKFSNEKVMNVDETLEIIREIYGEEIDEVYINFAAHIVYLIELDKT
ncbi:hypothetical protein MZM54_02850 [[Brevibacterium] frigoritolerans]|nr:hypothetical protein [Peribacillus frigoritolerans]